MMEIKKFVNKVRQISTGSHLLRLEDNRSEMPKSEPTVIIKGNGYGRTPFVKNTPLRLNKQLSEHQESRMSDKIYKVFEFDDSVALSVAQSYVKDRGFELAFVSTNTPRGIIMALAKNRKGYFSVLGIKRASVLEEE